MVKALAVITALSASFLSLGLWGFLTRSRIQEALDRAPSYGRRRKNFNAALGRIGDRLSAVPVIRDIVNYRATGLQLDMAGMKISPAEFYGLWAVSAAMGTILPTFINTMFFQRKIPAFIIAAVVLIGIVLPKAYLNNKAYKEQLKLNRDFIRFAEKMLIGISAGFDFYQVLRKVKSRPGFLYRQVEVMREEIEALIPVHEVLDRFAERLNCLMAYGFVSAIKHSLKYGVYYGDALAEYLEDLRQRRELKIEEVSRKMESRLIIPVVLTVLPATGILIILPLAIYLAKSYK